MMKPILVLWTLILATPFELPLQAASFPATFSYQGRLKEASGPATGLYQLTFRLWDAPNAGNQIGPTLTNTIAISEGLFTSVLDFSTNVFTGQTLWLELGVRTNGSTSAFALLAPRQQVFPTPYAVYSLEAGTAVSVSASNLLGTVPDASLSTNVALLNSSPIFAGTVTAGAFAGSGAGITNIPLYGLNSGGGANGQVLTYNGQVWVPANFANPSPVALSVAGTNVAVNAASGTILRVLCTTNVFIQNPIGGTDGQRIVFELIQDAVGGRTVAWDSKFGFGVDLGQADIALTPAPGKRDFVGCVFNAAADRWFVISFVRGY
jgi:hypothetical protein